MKRIWVIVTAILLGLALLILTGCEVYVAESNEPPVLQPYNTLTVLMRANETWEDRCINTYGGTPNTVIANTINPGWGTSKVFVCQDTQSYDQNAYP